MNKSLALIFSIAVCLSTARALNLQPQEIMVEKDGPPVRRYFFQDGGKRLLFRIDSAMKVRGSANEAVFQFSDIRNAAMKLSKSKVTPRTAFNDKGLKSYRQAARSRVPAEATDVQIVEENSGAVSINGWINHQFVFSYKLFGFPFRQSVTYFNYSPTEQLVFDVRSPEANYKKTYSRSYRVLNSISDSPWNRGPRNSRRVSAIRSTPDCFAAANFSDFRGQILLAFLDTHFAQ